MKPASLPAALVFAAVLPALAPLTAFAHGAVPKQASDAIAQATEQFVASNPAEVRRRFLSVSATLTGHERFEVTISLKDGEARFVYDCRENEEVEPVKWECSAR